MPMCVLGHHVAFSLISTQTFSNVLTYRQTDAQTSKECPFSGNNQFWQSSEEECRKARLGVC